jgi:hypothetical protein
MNFELKVEHLPFFLRGKADDIKVSKTALVLVSKKANLNGKTLTLNKGGVLLNFNLDFAKGSNNIPIPPCGDMYFYVAESSVKVPILKNWKATLGAAQDIIDPANVEDIIIGFNLNE